MCDTEASGITGVINDSYLDRIEQRPSGGTTVLWTDLPDQAMVFADATEAEEFCRDSPLEMFVVSFVPVTGTGAGSGVDPGSTPASRSRLTVTSATPAEPVNLAAELRAMGLM